ncbi:collagen-binding domain-containing protein [Olleya sp. ITB9]|uniref:collagen-binding domain-containing protein n=1 Tax=Olleya sp. ITB9 TaxID=1715648 RepID=UPI0006D18BE4|nr:collagen-binding domain-containing protein [Olleya sp. ITB9]
MKTKKLQFSRLKHNFFTLGLVFSSVSATLIAQNEPLNPTEAANNFTVFTSGDAIAMGTESEGSWAVGGSFTIDGSFNIFGGVNYFNNDAQPTALVVNQQVNYVSGQLHILDNNYIKIGDLSTSSIFNVDNNNTPINTRITYLDGTFNSNPKIELSTNQETASISDNPQIDFTGAFNQFTSISDILEAQATNVTWNENELNSGKLWVNLTVNQTNVINLTVNEFNQLSEIKFIDITPSSSTPFIVNITDSSSDPEVVTINSWPNIVGSPLEYASSILYNFPNVSTTIDYTGGAQIYGTIYAPNANFYNQSNSNIDGQIIAEVLLQNSGEIHSYPFDAIIDLEDPDPTEEVCDGIDNDNDGLIDEGFEDTDQDGVADCVDNCPLIANPNQEDENNNGIGDVCEEDTIEEVCDGIDNDNDGLIDEGFEDTDQDGVADCVDNCPLIANPNQEDENNNGIGDVCEENTTEEVCDGIDNDNDGLIDEGFEDTDQDGVADCVDNCPLIANPNQEDENNNGIGDVCEEDIIEEVCDGIDNDNDGLIDEGFEDTDQDGVADCVDNCPLIANPNQEDENNNGIGDVCEGDTIEEVCDGIDNDNDGLIDEGFEDTDQDGVADCVDNCVYYYNPDQLDSNQDGIGDICSNGTPSRIAVINLDIYPVPFKGILNLKYSTPYDTSVKIEIFDVRGTLIKQIDNLKTKASQDYVIKVDLTGTENQMLFISLTTNNGKIVKQVISN